MNIGNRTLDTPEFKIVLLSFIDHEAVIPHELRKEVLGHPAIYGRLWDEIHNSEISLYSDLMCTSRITDVCPSLEAHIKKKRAAELEFGIAHALHSTDCPMCSIVQHTSRHAYTSDGFVPRKVNADSEHKPLEEFVHWDDLLWAGTSAGWHYKSAKFLPFGRELPLLWKDYPPVHALDQCDQIYMSELLHDLKYAIWPQPARHPWRTNRETVARHGAVPCGTTFSKLLLHRDEMGSRYITMPTVMVSQYVGVAIVKPSPVRKARGGVRDFYDWRKSPSSGNDDCIVARRRSDWPGLCAHCVVALFKERSLTRALLHSGSPDVKLRLNSDYYEDLLEAAASAHASKEVRILVVEPIIQRST